MASYDGAVAAIQQRLRDNFTALPVAFQNEEPPQTPWPPADGSPFVYFEVIGTTGALRAFGTPGAQIWEYLGLIHAHVHVAINSGSALAQQRAREIGDVFRNAQFYADTPPSRVWTHSPQTDGGGPADQYAGYWRVTATARFEFLLQA